MFDVPPDATARALARWPADHRPDAAQRATLATLRGAVLERFTWPTEAAT